MVQIRKEPSPLTSRAACLLLLLFIGITFFANIGSTPTDIMEVRNVVTAREITADGNWMVPHMNGNLRLEKPPLPTWVAAAVYDVAPGSLAAQRIPAAVMACLWTLFLFLTVRLVSRRNDIAIATIVVFATCYNVVLMGRSATWDIYCHAFMMAALFFMMKGLIAQDKFTRWFLVAGVMMGLSFMSKGPVSFYALLLPLIPALIALPSTSVRGKWKAIILMIAITIIIGCWWYVALLILHPEAIKAVAAKESGAWGSHNVRPLWYYWRFFLEMGAWSLLMLASLAIPYWRHHITVKREYLFAMTWAVGSLILLSLMPEKKMRYLLPSLAPCSMVVACIIIHIKETVTADADNSLRRTSVVIARINSLVLALVMIAAPELIYKFGIEERIIPLSTFFIVTILLLADALFTVVVTWMNRPALQLVSVAVVFALVEIFLLPVIGSAVGNPDARSIARVNDDRRVDDLPFYYNDREGMRIEIVYYAGHVIRPVKLDNDTSLMRRLPCVLVTQEPAAKEIAGSMIGKIDMTPIGIYDDNKHPRTNRHYTPELISYVTVVREKKK